MISRFIWWLKALKMRLKSESVIRGNEPWILSRTACLGNDVYELLDLPLPRYHLQKARIDFLLAHMKNGGKHPPIHAAGYVADGLKPLFYQQYIATMNFNQSPAVLFMDSYSELVDQAFRFKKDPNSFFCACYTDVSRSIQAEFIEDGLLPEEKLENLYRTFFDEFRRQHPDTPIVYMNFPKKLDEREKFQRRHNTIKDIINRISSGMKDFYVFDVPEEIVDWDPKDKFRYHYAKPVYEYLAAEIRKAGVFSKYSAMK